MSATYDTIADALRAAGLTPRGGFAAAPGDHVPALADGRAACTLVLAGNVGGAMWAAFARSPEFAQPRDPLDAWTRRVLDDIAGRLGAAALYPFGGPPHHPFQRWAMRAQNVQPSPLGLLIHPEYGLWHAYRGALAFAQAIAVPERSAHPSPCASCPDRPCLGACPVSAFTGKSYDAAACAGHITAPAGQRCVSLGCAARLACPIGTGYHYGTEQQQFHMRAFRTARTRGGSEQEVS